MSVKHFAGFVIAGAFFAGFSAPPTDAATLQISSEAPLTVQTPTTAPSGLTLTSDSASVFTDGFVFCANIGTPSVVNFVLAPAHEDQDPSLSSAHPWKFPIAKDLGAVTFAGGTLSINVTGAKSPTLSCNTRGASGETVASPFGDEVFSDGYDDLLLSPHKQYPLMVNWVPPASFDWNTPDWTQVPVNACDSAQPQVAEPVACAAVTGVNPTATSVRAQTMTTFADNTAFNFYYMFRVDVLTQTGAGEPFVVRDAYDGTFLGASGGAYCFLATPPSSLSASACTNWLQLSAGGFLDYQGLSTGGQNAPFYIVVRRPMVGSHTNLTTPVVAASVFVDPAVSAEGGDRFRGDDVVFGFMQQSTGFPWMSGQ